jgi:hypothetical protein
MGFQRQRIAAAEYHSALSGNTAFNTLRRWRQQRLLPAGRCPASRRPGQ